MGVPATVRVEPVGTAAMPSSPLAWLDFEEGAEAPDLIEPLTAFRCWRVIDGRLRSPYLPAFWDERLLVARCHSEATGAGAGLLPHSPPITSCDCGIHAYPEPNIEFPTVDYRGVSGIVTLRGRVLVGPRGMRAELARLEALGFYSRWSRRQKREVSAIADRLEVDLVDLDDLANAAPDYGRPLDPELLSRVRAADPSPQRSPEPPVPVA
jgi:hypothetical protein